MTLGIRPIADAAESGDLRLDGEPRAVSGLTSLLQALTGPATAGGNGSEHDEHQPAGR
ncbi:MAG: hypothetical protein ACRDPO_19050 [Streptosporangiaceae bacterium]